MFNVRLGGASSILIVSDEIAAGTASRSVGRRSWRACCSATSENRAMATEPDATTGSLTIADQYDADLRRNHERFMAAMRIGPGDRVLDVGCGVGQTTRQAARVAVSGSVLGVDVSESMLERARRLTAAAGLGNARYELGDIEVHRLPREHFDVVISCFGTMFFADPVAAFRNIARAARPA
jgi:SAM-dependent methyltransferase